MIKFKRIMKKINRLIMGNVLNIIYLPIALIIVILRNSEKLSHKIESIIKKSI